MKTTDKIVTSVTAPQSTNVMWHNPETRKLKFFGQMGWEDVGGTSDSGVITTIIPITYSELVHLRDEEKLIPGQQYRITDYVATTIDPHSQSANHPFDIIVTAQSNNSLSEDARAALHEGDTYFSKCDIDAWKLKYTIDNNSAKYSWADEPFYGYKGIRDWGDGDIEEYNLVLVDDNNTEYDGYKYKFEYATDSELRYYSKELTGQNMEIKQYIYGNIDDIQVTIYYESHEGGKGIIYNMIDENNNEASFDFKGIQFKRYKITDCAATSLIGKYHSTYLGNLRIDEQDVYWMYLFTCMQGETIIDHSTQYKDFRCNPPMNNVFTCANTLVDGVTIHGGRLVGTVGCRSKGSTGWTSYEMSLNWNVDTGCDSWLVGSGCSNWTCEENVQDFYIANGNNWVIQKNNRYFGITSSSGDFVILPETFNIYTEDYDGDNAYLVHTPRIDWGVTYIGRNSDCQLKMWNPADLVQ